jgi:hypothetical protein
MCCVAPLCQCAGQLRLHPVLLCWQRDHQEAVAVACMCSRQIAADKCNAHAFTLCSQVLDQCNALWCRALPLWHMASPPPPSSAPVLCDCSCTVHGTALPVAHCFIQQQEIL